LRTFDQIVASSNGDVAGADVSPNWRQDAELVMEPGAGGINVTVRDKDHNTLISFIAGRSGTSDMTAQVALMKEMRTLVRDRLSASAAPPRELDAKTALEAIDAFRRDVLDRLRESVDTQKESQATRIRAAAIVDSLLDARKTIGDITAAARS
jgi:hypothetical protein